MPYIVFACRKKGTLLFDGSANPSAATTDDTLLEEINKNGGVDTSPNTHGRSKVPSTATISSEPEESKENPLHEDGQAGLKGLSADAKDVYLLVRDKLAGSSNKKVACAASVGAVLLARHAENLEEAAAATRAIAGKRLTNDLLGVDAFLSKKNIGKMVSASATRKSVDARVHALAVAYVDHLLSRAITEYTHKDRDNDKNIKQIHRMFSPFVVGDNVYVAKLTVKELVQEKEGNRLYSVEALEIKEASRKWNAAYNATEGVLTSFPQEAFDNIIARFLPDGKNCSKIVDGNGCRFVNHVLHKREIEKEPHEEISILGDA